MSYNLIDEDIFLLNLSRFSSSGCFAQPIAELEEGFALEIIARRYWLHYFTTLFTLWEACIIISGKLSNACVLAFELG